jgi:predicted amidohydrolase YtcJ
MALTLVANAQIRTLDARQPQTTALAVHNGVIVAEGTGAEIQALASRQHTGPLE